MTRITPCARRLKTTSIYSFRFGTRYIDIFHNGRSSPDATFLSKLNFSKMSLKGAWQEKFVMHNFFTKKCINLISRITSCIAFDLVLYIYILYVVAQRLDLTRLDIFFQKFFKFLDKQTFFQYARLKKFYHTNYFSRNVKVVPIATCIKTDAYGLSFSSATCDLVLDIYSSIKLILQPTRYLA